VPAQQRGSLTFVRRSEKHDVQTAVAPPRPSHHPLNQSAEAHPAQELHHSGAAYSSYISGHSNAAHLAVKIHFNVGRKKRGKCRPGADQIAVLPRAGVGVVGGVCGC